MRFAILGPVEVTSGTESVPISRPRHRAVLAYLLLNANQVVSVDQITQALWASAPPSTAKSQLHAMISTLRRDLALPPGTGSGIETAMGGYMHSIRPGQLDLTVFNQLVATARDALTSADWQTAAKCLRDALGLWRGPALGGVKAPYADSVRVRLEEERLQAQEFLIEAELAMGRHIPVLGEVRRLVDQFPLRERLVMQLMLALHRSDRRTDALQVARELRHRLSEEQGLDPGVLFAELERSILRADPALDWTRQETQVPVDEGASLSPRVAARQLPTPPAIFVGRDAIIADLETQLGANRAFPVTAINGAGGTGKSALALLVSHRIVDRFPDGQLYVDLQGDRVGLAPLAPSEVLGRFLRALGTPPSLVPDSADEAAALYRSMLSQRSVLILLDNAVDVGQVRPLLPGSLMCGVLLTSRRALSTLDAHHLKLGPLTEPEALKLLADCAGKQQVSADPATAQTIVRFCEHVPLAIRIAGARLSGDAGLSMAEFGRRLAVERRRLDLLQLDDLAVRACFQTSYQALGGLDQTGHLDAALAFRRLGLLRVSHLTPPVVAALLDASVEESENVMGQLAAARLIDQDDHRWRMHDLLRLFAIELADHEDPPQQQAQALQRALTCYLGAVRRSSSLTRPGQSLDGEDELADLPYADLIRMTSAAEGTAWLESERANLMGLARQMADAAEPLCRFTLRLSTAMRMFLPLRGYLADWEELCVLSLQVARRLKIRAAEAVALMDLGAIAQRTGRLTDAITHLNNALTIATVDGHVSTQAGISSYLGSTYAAAGEGDMTVAAYDQAIALRRQIGDDASTAITLTNAGIACTAVNLFADAARYIDESIKLKIAGGNRHGEGVARIVAAGTYLAQGCGEEALSSVNIGLGLCQEFGDRHNVWIALIVRATIHRHAGRRLDSAHDAEQAARICRENGDSAGEALAVRQLHSANMLTHVAPTTDRTWYPGLAWVIALTNLPCPTTASQI